MSRIGKLPVKISAGLKVALKDNNRVVHVEGPVGKLSHVIPEGISVKVEKDILTLDRDDKVEGAAALHGLTRTLVNNMMVGCHTGFTRELDIVGVGYRAATKGSTLQLTLGFSHTIDYEMPKGITVKVDKNTRVIINGADKVLVGMVAAKVRSFRPPEPYQGKGVKYSDEKIVRKQGKTAGK
jgi:large subunit ribosomal protein L6